MSSTQNPPRSKPLVSLAEDKEKFHQHFHALSWQVRIGEEDYEIQYDLEYAGIYAGRLLGHYLMRGSDLKDCPPEVFEPIGCAMFRWVYLVNLRRTSSITRLSERQLEGFFLQFMEEAQITQPEKLAAYFFHFSSLFYALEEAGVPVNAPLRDKQIQKILRKFSRKSAAELTLH